MTMTIVRRHRLRLHLLLWIISLAAPAGCRRAEAPAVPHELARQITVTGSDEYLELRFDGRLKDAVDTTTGISAARYVAVLDMPRRYLGMPGKVLISGMGSGALAESYARLGWRVTVAEPDSRIVDIARRRFRLGDTIAVVLQDARTLLASGTGSYDVVLLDVVGEPKAPGALLTREFFALASQRLGERGILGIAIEAEGWDSEVVRLLTTTLATVFRQVTVMPIAEPPDRFGSIVVIASRTVRNDLLIDVERNTTFHPDWRYGPEYQKTHAWDNHFTMRPARVPLQTDRDNRWEAIFAALDAEAREQKADYLP